jgi:hypothetical protein
MAADYFPNISRREKTTNAARIVDELSSGPRSVEATVTFRQPPSKIGKDSDSSVDGFVMSDMQLRVLRYSGSWTVAQTACEKQAEKPLVWLFEAPSANAIRLSMFCSNADSRVCARLGALSPNIGQSDRSLRPLITLSTNLL